MISVITPTADRPVAIALAEQYMARQTLKPDEWIIADGGEVPVTCSMGQKHIHQPKPSGAENFLNNLLAGIEEVRGDVVVIVEDDDWYAPTHLESMVADLANVGAAGDDSQRYYNVHHRCWRVFQNKGASLCQTAMRRDLLPKFKDAITRALAVSRFFVDYLFWESVPVEQKRLRRMDTVVGIKGLPGRPGLGIGHRPSGAQWRADPEMVKLAEWIGDDVALYRNSRSVAA